MKLVWKIVFSVILLAAFVATLFVGTMDYNQLQNQGRRQEELDRRIGQVMLVWAGIKTASGIISFLQTIEVQGSIVAVSVSGQPLGWAEVVDNTLDKVSNILLWAAGALAIQKIVLAMSYWVSLRIIIPLAIILLIVSLWNNRLAGRLKNVAGGVIIITIALCLAIPLSLELSNVVEANFLYSHINQTVSGIEDSAREIDERGGQANNLDTLRRIGVNVAGFFAGIVDYFWNLIDRTINFIMTFIVVNILIPLGTLFFLKYLVKVVLIQIGFSKLR